MRDATNDGYALLTEKEKQTLRLIVRGHDAKSAARQLDLSVHTINERLREARRKLSVSSSREAARLLFEQEGTDPEYSADKQIGEAVPSADVGPGAGRRRRRRVARIWTGAAIMTFALGLLALIALPQLTSAPEGGTTAAASKNPAIEQSARAWLALVDQSRWEESWAATAASFRRSNTSKVWATVSEQVRVPLGAMRSRVLLSQDSVPAPPAGVEVIKFKTSFANKPEAVETVSLALEEGQWRVVGVYIE